MSLSCSSSISAKEPILYAWFLGGKKHVFMVLGRLVVGMIPLHSLKQKTLKHIAATPNPPQSIRPGCLRYYFRHVNRIPMDPT